MGSPFPGRSQLSDDSVWTLPFAALLLVAAFAAGSFAQGGYYLPGRLTVAALVLTGGAAAVYLRSSARQVLPVLLGCTGLATWATVRAVADGSPPDALSLVLALAGLAGAAFIAAGCDTAGRRSLGAAAIGVGVLVALTGWVGVALHREPWGLVVGGVWRASAVLTYANAAAALLAALALLSLGWLVQRPHSALRSGAAYLLLLGLAATVSRAGALAFLVGFVVLAVKAGPLVVLRQAASPVLGALVAAAALVPSMPATAPQRPMFAAIGLFAGLVLTLVLGASGVGSAAVLTAVVLIVGGGAAAVATGAGGADTAFRTLLERRLTAESSGRSGPLDSAFRMVSERPLIGTGPGKGTFSWLAPDGRVLVARYAHDEYLQLLVELGAVGLALLLVLVVAIVVTVRRSRGAVEPALRAGAIAALIALAVHSAFDFLWQLPVVLLLVGLLVGIVAPAAGAVRSGPPRAEESV